jgi:KDO2-lipid IV(A) lauroyltransferase
VKPTARDRIEYALFRLLRAVLTALPESVSRSLGSALGWVAGVVVGLRRQVVLENLKIAFPDLDPGERRRLARRSWAHLGREAVATFLLGAETPESIRSRIEEWDGFDAFEARVREGRGAVAVSGHFGNWEMAGAAVASRGLHMDAVATTQRNPLFDRDLVETRANLGLAIVPRDEAPRRILRGLRAGHVAGIVGDQNVAVGGIHVDFMGRPAVTARGAAVFALRTGAPLFVGHVMALPGSRWRYRFSVEEVTIEPSGDFDEDVRRLTQAHTNILERAVRAHPEQYFWPHKRWKERATTK